MLEDVESSGARAMTKARRLAAHVLEHRGLGLNPAQTARPTWSSFRLTSRVGSFLQNRPGKGFRVQGSGFTVQGSGFTVQGSGFTVQGSRTVRGSCQLAWSVALQILRRSGATEGHSEQITMAFWMLAFAAWPLFRSTRIPRRLPAFEGAPRRDLPVDRRGTDSKERQVPRPDPPILELAAGQYR